MSTYNAHTILTLRRLLEADGDTNPDLTARQWCEKGWRDPAAAYREWSGLGVDDPDLAWEMHEAGVKPAQAAREVTVGGVKDTVAAHVLNENVTVTEAATEIGVNPLADLRRLAQGRAKAEHALAEIRRLGQVKIRQAHEQGVPAAKIADAFDVSRSGIYQALEG